MENFQKFYNIYRQRFGQAYDAALEGLGPEEKLDITNHLLALIKCFQQEKPDYDKIKELTDVLYKKYRKRLSNYDNSQVYEYFTEQSLKHLDLQFELEIPNAGREDNYFTQEQHQRFLRDTESYLLNEKRFTYLSSDEPEQEPLEGLKTKTRGKIKRDREDNMTCLNQEQTALLVYCLRRTKVILPEAYLSNKETGLAFSILSGYSADTLRQNLSKSELARLATEKNAEAVTKALKDMQKLIEDEIQPEG